MNFFRKKKYKMDTNTADQTLQNVLAACNRPASTLPVDKLMLNRKMTRAPYIHAIILATCALILCLLCPLAFVPRFLPLEAVSASGEAITLTGSYESDGYNYIRLSEQNIDLDRTYMQTNSGKHFAAKASRKDTVQFPYPSEESNIYICDTNGQVLHLLLTPQ